MGVDVVWRCSDGSAEEIGDSESHFSSALMSFKRGDYPTLERIDIYRRTELTPCEALIAELARLRDSTADVAARLQLSQVLSLFRRAAFDPESQLVFLGD